MRDEYRTAPGSVRYLEGDDVVPAIAAIWDRFQNRRAGETGRTLEVQQYLFEQRNKPWGSQSPMAYSAHDDGYVAYRIDARWNDGRPAQHRCTSSSWSR